MKRFNKQPGFTLVEMTIVLLVISLILSGVITSVGVQRQQLKRDETRRQLELIREALIGFALTQGRLPCPDTGVDGQADPAAPVAGAGCNSTEGWLPHVDIGIGNIDAWGNRYRYRVSNSYVDEPTPPAQSSFSVGQNGDLTVDDENGNSIAINIPAVVVSYGDNGRRLPANCGALSAREQENCNNDNTLLSSFYSDVAGKQFDDLLVWIPNTVLKSRMIEARRLP